ncbi:MAG: peptidylprolyl isomerase [Wenzhouxiangella sp.]|nr:peptidylprolyl isomerase [Wenzhouxiangella sp.]
MNMQSSHEAVVTPPPIRVDEREITIEDIAREVQYHPAPNLGEARRRAARALVIRELLLAECDRQKICAESGQEGESDEESRIRQLLEEHIEVPEPQESDCRRYYDANRDKMRTADEHEVSHILVPAPPDDEKLRAEARKKALGLTQELKAHPDRFVSMAGDFSSCPSKDVGGHLGIIARGQTVPEFEKALSRLPVGEIPDYPVETRFGFHVVMVHQRAEGHPVPFDQCRSKIANYLREHVRRRAISQFIQVVAGEHRIEGFDLEAANSPLVQ